MCVVYKQRRFICFFNNFLNMFMHMRIPSSFPMEITFSSASSTSCFLTPNCPTSVVSPQRRSRRSLPIIPSVTIVSKLNELTQVYPRRSAQYHPSVWDLKLIESLSTPYTVSPLVVIFLSYSQTIPPRCACN